MNVFIFYNFLRVQWTIISMKEDQSLVSFPGTELGCCVGEGAWTANMEPKIG